MHSYEGSAEKRMRNPRSSAASELGIWGPDTRNLRLQRFRKASCDIPNLGAIQRFLKAQITHERQR